MLNVFQRLKALRQFERQQLAFLMTLEDCDLVCEIGVRQALGQPLTVKQVFLLGLGSVPTVQRRLARLRRLGVIQQRRADADRRSVEITLAPKALKALQGYEAFLG
jgi:DNA-binding MarR family transcriptional regulator